MSLGHCALAPRGVRQNPAGRPAQTRWALCCRMSRLHTEFQRLYLPPLPDGAAPTLVDAQGQVRAMVLGLAGPADWPALAAVWQGVQAELDLPAPAIVVAGDAGYQLWFSLAQPVPAAQARGFVLALQQRWLAGVKPQRVACWPSADGPPRHARPVPAPLAEGGPWSAFVAQDLAPVFGDEPWLDQPPNPDGQATLLAGLASMPLADFGQALRLLQPAAPDTPPAGQAGLADAPDAVAAARSGQVGQVGPFTDPRQFLLAVMNTDTAPLALRIQAAQALLSAPPAP